MSTRLVLRLASALVLGGSAVASSGVASLALTVAKPAPADAPRPTPSATAAKLSGATTKENAMLIAFPGGKRVLDILRFEMSAAVPHDSQSGLPSGKRQHGVVTITREVDEASPEILRAHDSQTGLSSVVVHYNGRTITLTNALVSGVETEPKSVPIEHITFVFEKITSTQSQSGTSAADDWNSPT